MNDTPSGCEAHRLSMVPLWIIVATLLALTLTACASPAKPGPDLDLAAHPHLARTLAAGHTPADRCALPSSAPGGAAVATPSGFVGHVGRWLVDPHGRVLLLHGVNEVAKRPPYAPCAFGFDTADAAWLAANGFRVVRLGVLFSGLLPGPGQVSTVYLSELASTVDLLARYHIYTLLDFHQDGFGPSVGSDGFPPWMTVTGHAVRVKSSFPLYYIQDPAIQQAFQSFWDNADGPGGTRLQQDAIAGYEAVARRFKTDPWVIGYDILNEPWPGTTWQACISATGCPGLVRSELMPFYDRVDTAIRRFDPNHLIFEEPFVLFDFGTAPATEALPNADPRSGLSFHMYTLSSGDEPTLIDHAIEWAHHTGGALLNTEWDSTTGAAGVERQSGELDSALLPWIYWAFADCSVGCRSAGDQVGIVGSLGADPSGANLNHPIASSIVQPYPLAIAGTPTSLTYDATTRVLALTWSTARAGGGSFAANTPTTIEVPPAVYPTGYHVHATGAAIISKPCSQIVKLVADPRKSQASVSLTPGAGCRR